MSSRKELLQSAGLLSAGIAMGMSPFSKQIRRFSGKRPDILLLLADDMAWPHASIYPQSDEVINTPTFDRVTRSGNKKTLKKYRKILKEWMQETNDPRIAGHAQFDDMPYYGPAPGKHLNGNGFGNTFGPPTREYQD